MYRISFFKQDREGYEDLEGYRLASLWRDLMVRNGFEIIDFRKVG